MARDLEKIAQRPEQLERIVTIEAIYEDYVKTDHGDYFIENGRNMDAPCGCNRFCDCYGVVDVMTPCQQRQGCGD
jgi:hypothetical protein